MVTENMRKFIDKNKTVKVLEGARLTPEGKQIENTSDMYRSDRTKYRFTDGESITLTKADAQSGAGYHPIWDIK